MWSILHDILVNIFGRIDLERRKPDAEYAAYRRGRRLRELTSDGRPLIWLHGVSLGEVNALGGLVAELRKQTGGRIAIAISTMTATGLPAARKLNPEHAFIYPLDLSKFAREIVRRLQPKALVILDGDFWYQMMRSGPPVVVVNGRMSEKSVQRRAWLASYTRQMFASIQLASVQSEKMAERFARFIPRERIEIDGNIKLDIPSEAVRMDCGKDATLFRIVFGSIHPEELDAIADPIRRALADRSHLQILIVPRHPDKFTPAVLKKYFPGIDAKWIDSDEPFPNARLVWVNRLGVLRNLYQTADAAFVGGTFCGVGGHNLAEPSLACVPVVYGPQVHAQLPLHELLTAYKASIQAASAEELYTAIVALSDTPLLRAGMTRGASNLRDDSRGINARLASKILEIACVNMV